MEMVILVAVACAAFLLFSYFDARNKYLEQQVRAEFEEIMKNMVQTKLEVHHDCFYLFREDNDSFVAQGRNAQELLANINVRFRRMKFFITQGDSQSLETLQAQLDALGDQPTLQGQ